MARISVLVIAAVALFAAAARAQCLLFTGGLFFDLGLANNGLDATAAMGATGYNAVINSCRSIESTDAGICQPGTLACQKAASSGTPFKCMARNITASAVNGAQLQVIYGNGDFCPNVGTNRRVVITYTCATPGNAAPTYVSESPNCTFNFNWASPAGCGSASSPAPTTPAPVVPVNLFVGGAFTTAGTISANRIAKWTSADTSAWLPLAAGVSGTAVFAVNNYNGALVAAGDFITAGNVTASRVARWDGTTWSALGAGVGGPAYALTVFTNNLVVGGLFSLAGSDVTANNIAQWSGSAWSTFGTGFGGAVRALAVFNSTLVAGGNFVTAGSTTVGYVARWNGATWSALATGLNDAVYALAAYNGGLVAGGFFSSPSTYVARWNGVGWLAMGAGLTGGEVLSLVVYNNELYAGGYFDTSASVATRGIGRWNEATSSWAGVGGGLGTPADRTYALAVVGRFLIAGGTFTTAGSISANRVAQWNGGSWSALATGVAATAYALVEESSGPAPTTAPTATPPPGACSLGAFDWTSQYYLNGTLVGELLIFDETLETFEQNTTAFEFQLCRDNWIDWRGNYEVASSSSLILSFVRCEQSAIGCLECGPSFEETVDYSFAADCETLTITYPDSDPRSYFPAKAA